MLAWIALALAGLAEIGWAIGLKHTDGWSRLWPSVITVALMVVSVVLLAYAIRTIPVGTGYAVWTGIGAVGVAIVGIITLGESAAPLRLACIGLIALGIIGLKLAGD